MAYAAAMLLSAHPPVTAARAPDNTAARLPKLIETYFQAPNNNVRSALAGDIESLEGITIEAVAEAVQNVQLWQPRTPGFEHFVLDTRRGVPMDVHVHVPAGYDPTRAYPLLLAFHGSTGTGGGYIHFALQLLEDRRNEYIVAAPTRLEGPFISSQPDEAFDLPDLLRELKQRYHIDTDRVYASGYSRGGHTSFLIGLLYTDVIAATVPLAGTFATQVGYGLMDVMLPNIRHLPTLVVYGELDRTERDGEEGGIAISNQYMARVARRLDVPVQLVELEGVGHTNVRPPPDRFHEMLRQSRPHDIKQFQHWFRHLPQGRLNFLRQTRFLGIPWKARQLHVRLKDGETYSEAFDRTIRLKLAYIGGKIEGQSIHIETRKCGEVALLLNGQLIDLDRDITVKLNGREIYKGPAKRSIRTLLEVAHEDWDFQRLFTTRFRITRKGTIKQTGLR